MKNQNTEEKLERLEHTVKEFFSFLNDEVEHMENLRMSYRGDPLNDMRLGGKIAMGELCYKVWREMEKENDLREANK